MSKTENLTGYDITEKREVLSMKYSEWLNIWLENYVKPTHKIRTFDLYRQMVEKKIVPYLGDYDMNELAPITIQCYATEMIKKGNTRTGKGLSSNNDIDFKPCVIAENREVLPRPQKNLVLGERVNGIIEDNGTFLSVDLGKETAGFAELSFVSPIEQEIKVGYGEFLFNGRVAVEIGGRDFSFEIKAKKGKNNLIFPLRRIAGR